MLHQSLALALAAALTGCLASRDPELQLGPGAEVTVDGLHRVDHVPFGTLYMRPDYVFGSYHYFTMGKTHVSFRRGSRVLDDAEVAELTRRFEAMVRQTALSGGRVEVPEPGPCVVRLSLGLVEVDLLDPKDLTAQGTSTVMESFGSITFVLEVRDGYTGEALLRYGRRRKIQGGPGTGVDPAELNALTTTLEDFARGAEQEFRNVLPRIEPVDPVSCEERAGLPAPAGTR